jgi:hypothetical protein
MNTITMTCAIITLTPQSRHDCTQPNHAVVPGPCLSLMSCQTSTSDLHAHARACTSRYQLGLGLVT